ncbi:hypothetical protein GCM10010191_44610 [Actinomadura vinacea]|uniref:ESAT-6-like protein n=1 Tax=Actinomadura vinacea TaxID=115336 RepID=A0ABP5WJX8_9ACTN
MGDYTRANFNVLTEGEAQFTRAARALMDELSDLEGKLKSKLNMWEGQAQDEYWKFQGQWQAAAQDMQRITGELGAVIRNAHDNYQAAEKKNYGVWAG